MITTVDNRIVQSRLPTCTLSTYKKGHQFHEEKKGGHLERWAFIGQWKTPYHGYTAAHMQK